MSVPVGVCPQVNKFEQVSSDDHQMSLSGVSKSGGSGYVMRGNVQGNGYVQWRGTPTM